MNRTVLGYWDFRGLGEPARLLLTYAGVDFVDKRYREDNAEEWTKDKHALDFDFPNLPYLIDGNVKLTESAAIVRYLGRKFDLYPTTESALRDCDILEGVANDLRLRMSLLAYMMPNIPDQLQETKQVCSAKIEQIEQFLVGKKYVAGDKITYIDFVLCEFLDRQQVLFKDILETRKNVKDYLLRFKSLPPIKKFFSSDDYKEFPIHGMQANWGGKSYDDRSW